MARKKKNEERERNKHRFYPVAVHLNRKSIITKLYVTRSQYCSSIHKNNRCAALQLANGNNFVQRKFMYHIHGNHLSICSIYLCVRQNWPIDRYQRKQKWEEKHTHTHTIFPADIFVLIDLWIGFYLLSCLFSLRPMCFSLNFISNSIFPLFPSILIPT